MFLIYVPGSSHNGDDADHLVRCHQIEMIGQLPEVSQYIQVDVCNQATGSKNWVKKDEESMDQYVLSPYF
jgi:hypothetical protein